MSYREENGQVVLTMSKEDWEMFSHGVRQSLKLWMGSRRMLEVWERLNEGNPNYMPYTASDVPPANERPGEAFRRK